MAKAAGILEIKKRTRKGKIKIHPVHLFAK
jgi:hypothetical protein